MLLPTAVDTLNSFAQFNEDAAVNFLHRIVGLKTRTAGAGAPREPVPFVASEKTPHLNAWYYWSLAELGPLAHAEEYRAMADEQARGTPAELRHLPLIHFQELFESVLIRRDPGFDENDVRSKMARIEDIQRDLWGR